MPQLGKSTLGRKKAPRKALLLQATNALLQHKRIVTTKVKAKMVARYIAPIISKAKRNQEKDPLHAKRQAFDALRNKKSTNMLLKEILPQIGERPGGYTRIITLNRRAGDAAPTALLELVDYNLLYSRKKNKSKTTRRGRKKSAHEKIDATAEPLKSANSTEKTSSPEVPQETKPEVPSQKEASKQETSLETKEEEASSKQ